MPLAFSATQNPSFLCYVQGTNGQSISIAGRVGVVGVSITPIINIRLSLEPTSPRVAEDGHGQRLATEMEQ